MKKLTKVVAMIIVIATFFSFSLFKVVAIESFNPDQKGSIVIEYTNSDTPLENVKFNIYHVATLNSDRKYTLNDDFKKLDIDFSNLSTNSEIKRVSDKLKNYINYEMIQPQKTLITDCCGVCKIENLDLGMYFITAQMTTEGETDIFAEPILIAVGNYDKNQNKWIYDYTVKPKVSVVEGDSYNISVKKVWENVNLDSLLPKEIQVELHCNGQMYDVVTLSAKNNWSYTWKDINPSDCWAVKELTTLKDFEVSYGKEMFSFTITNTYVGTPPTEGDKPNTGENATIPYAVSLIGVSILCLLLLLKFKIKTNKNV